jgi:membrane-associated phospholipid phosphatase
MLIFSVFIFWRFAEELVEEELHIFDITIIDWV